MKRILFVLAITALLIPSPGSAQQADEEPEKTSLAELPYWPVGMLWPDDLMKDWKPIKRRNPPQAEILVWTPPGVKRIRAVLMIPNNSDSKHIGEHEAVRKVLTKHEAGVVYLRQLDGDVVERVDPPVATNTIPALFDLIAKETGIAEFRHVPWVTVGKSSRGRFPFRMAWQYPERTIAGISYHGETPWWPMPDWSLVTDQTIPYVNINGEHEWDRTWYRHVRPSLLNYRAKTAWLPHQVVVYGVSHGDYADVNGGPGWGKPVPDTTTSVLRVWDYIAVYLDKVLTLRLPQDVYPTDGPMKLQQIDPDSGYLIHPRAVEECLGIQWRPLRKEGDTYTIVDHNKEPGEIYDPNPGTVDPSLLVRKASDVPAEERRNYFWIADKEQARAWLDLMNVKKLLINLGD